MISTRLFIFIPAIALGSIAFIAASTIEPLAIRAVLTVAAAAAMTALIARAAMIFEDMAPWVEGSERRSGSDRRAAANIESMQDRRRPTFDRDTGLCLGWYFRLRAEDEIARAERYVLTFSVLCVQGGEGLTMAGAGRALKHALREVDYAGDMGDYIAIVLPNTGREGAETLAGRLAAVAKLTATRVAAYPEDGTTLSQLLGEPEWLTSDQGAVA